MRETVSSTGDITTRLACQDVVRTLIEKYQWALLEENELVELVLSSMQVGSVPARLEQRVIHQYTVVLHEACRQVEDSDRRERGYYELFRFLFRAAYNKWPDLAEVVTQRALVLVFEQLDRCQSPGTFGAFALNKLWQAYKDELRERGKALLWEELGYGIVEPVGTMHPSSVDRQETLRVVVDGIKQLPNKRQQKVILLKFLGGLSDEAIAARLGITVGNVRVLRHRGLALLRKDKQLRDYFSEF